MNDLKPYAVFAATVAAGSMSAAARRLGMSPSAVSQTIRLLEKQAGVALLIRSTRKLSLTEAGERCYPHCLRLFEAANAAADSLSHARDAPSGELRISAPVGFAIHIAPALAPLLAASPQLRLALLLDDAMIDLIDARIDIAIRVGRLADSSWLARPLCELENVLCASPVFMDGRKAPVSPSELVSYPWLAPISETMDAAHDHGAAATERARTLRLDLYHKSREHQRVEVKVRIGSNNHIALLQMCEQGLGVASLGQADVVSSLARGSLVRLLPHWHFKSRRVTAVTQRRDGEPAKVRLAVDALKRYFGALLTNT